MALDGTNRNTGREREVDGLRAFAVVAVLLFHSKISSCFSGGFLGVDIFFVISGYVVTLSIRRQIRQNKFCFLEFMQRRVLRLLPALLTVLFFSNLTVSYLFPYDYRRKAARLSIEGLLSFSNISLWLQSGYFDYSSRMKPYLHTWSLSVEWQFYLSWAPISLFISKFESKKHLQIGIIILLKLASLVSGEIFLQTNPSAVFFNIPFRYSEFLIGSLAAWITFDKQKSETEVSTTDTNPQSVYIKLHGMLYYFKETICAMSLAALTFHIFWFDESFKFPGLNALPVCAATIIIIAYSKNTYVGNILTNRLVLFIGDISYSVYLVHWPLFVIFEYKYGRKYGLAPKFLLIQICLLSGYLLYKGVEKPFTSMKSHNFRTCGRKMKIVIAGCVILVIQAIFMHVDYTNLIGNRTWLDTAIQEVNDQWPLDCRAIGQPICHLMTNGKYSSLKECNPNPGKKPQIFLLGDSHAGGFYFPLSTLFPEVDIIQISGNGCNFFRNAEPGLRSEHCPRVEERFQEIVQRSTDNIVGAIFINYWKAPVQERNYSRLFDKIQLLNAKGIQSFVFGIRPLFEVKPKDILSRAFERESNFTVDMAKYIMKKNQVMSVFDDDKWLERKISKFDAFYISELNILCNFTGIPLPKTCTYPILSDESDGIHLLYIDTHHFTVRGNELILRRVLPQIKSLLGDKIYRNQMSPHSK